MKVFIVFVLTTLLVYLLVPYLADGAFYIHTKLNQVFKYAYIDDKDNSSGYWTDEQRKTHITSKDLVKYLIKFYKENDVKSVLDLGCGNCSVVAELNKNNIKATGVDQNNLIAHSVKHDLTTPYFNPKDYVQSFEVGEHIPKEFESIFIDNITKNARKGIILSWAIPGQGGDGHINEQPTSYIVKEMKKRGFQFDKTKSLQLRDSIPPNVYFLYFRHNLMVFNRIANSK